MISGEVSEMAWKERVDVGLMITEESNVRLRVQVLSYRSVV